MIIKAKNQNIYYEEYGEGLPLVVLHGLSLDSLCMINAIENTGINLKGFRRIYIDMPGMGQSPSHGLANNSDSMLDILAECVSELIDDRPFIVLGYSYGGYLAQGLAKRFRYQVIGEVQICPVVIPDKKNRKPAKIFNHEIDVNFFAGLTPKQQQEMMKNMVVINERTYQRNQADFSRAIALSNKDFLRELFIEANYRSAYIEKNTMIHEHKTLIFLGYQDNVTGYQDMMDQLVNYPKATVSLMTNASHSFFLEQPKEFERKLNSWLSQYK